MINYCAFKELAILYWGHIISVNAKISSGSYFCIIFRCYIYISVQFSSVAQSCLILCNPVDCSTPGLPVHHQLPAFTVYIYVLCVSLVVSYSVLSSRSPVEFILCLKSIKFVGRSMSGLLPLDVYIQFFL